MDIAATVLLSLAVVFVGAWLLAVVAIFVKALRPGALLQRGNIELPRAKRLILALCALPLILVLAAATVVNTVVFVGALCWHRLRRKPLPTEPSSRNRGDRAA
jgi:hydrogenase/urease accessory protein HupE